MRSRASLAGGLRRKIAWLFFSALALLMAAPAVAAETACPVDDHTCVSSRVQGRVEAMRVRTRPDTAPTPFFVPMHGARSMFDSAAAASMPTLARPAPRPKPALATSTRLLI